MAGGTSRFQLLARVESPTEGYGITFKADLDDEAPTADTWIPVYAGANWHEREAYEMYGVTFVGHPNLRKLYLPGDFEGHPLRKDFPLTGYVEVRWDDEQKRIVYEPVKLTQDFRNFDFLSPWEGLQALLPGDEKAKSGGKH